jgi:hypothetical protein
MLNKENEGYSAFELRVAQEDVEDNNTIFNKCTSYQHGIALHFFDHAAVDWLSWHEFVIDTWESLGLTPHRASLHGESYGGSTYTSTYKAAAKKLENNDYQKITSCNFIVIKDEFIKEKDVSQSLSKAAIYAGFSYGEFENPNPNKAEAFFLIDEKVHGAKMDWILRLASELQQLTGAKYGYHFRYPLEASPGSYVSGRDYLSKTVEEYLRVNKWKKFLDDLSSGIKGEQIGVNSMKWPIYSYTQYKLEEKALLHLRDIYEYNFITEFHLGLKVDSAGTTLGQWIKADTENRGDYIKLHRDFYCWIVEEEEEREHVRQELAASGIIICV